MRLRRRNLVWLGILGALLGIVLLSGAATAEVALTLVGLYAVAALATLIEIAPRRLLSQSRASLTMMRMSADAREAVERARRRGGLPDGGLTLLDIGLITSQASPDGMVMRRTRAVSQDDDGVRPFITLHVQPHESDRRALIRFEMIDQNGQVQYVHEMQTYLRDSEMNILADHHLPLFDNPAITGAGDWDLRVLIDGRLMGAYGFTLSPSIRDRFPHLARSREAADRRLSGEGRVLRGADDGPMSLEELLRRSQTDASARSTRRR